MKVKQIKALLDGLDDESDVVVDMHQLINEGIHGTSQRHYHGALVGIELNDKKIILKAVGK